MPQIVSVSPAHSVKSLPHFSRMHPRRPVSHALLLPVVVAFDAVVVADIESSSARCAAIKLAKVVFDESVFDVLDSDRISSNWDDLFSIVISGSGVSWVVDSGSSVIWVLLG